MTPLMMDNSEAVASWVAYKFDATFALVLGTIGRLDQNGVLIGAAVLHNYTRHEVELTYFGKGTMSLDMCKAIAWMAFERGRVLRLSITVPRKKKRLLRAVSKIGWRYEGTRRRYFGPAKTLDGLVYSFLRDEAGKFLRGYDEQRAKAA